MRHIGLASVLVFASGCAEVPDGDLDAMVGPVLGSDASPALDGTFPLFDAAMGWDAGSSADAALTDAALADASGRDAAVDASRPDAGQGDAQVVDGGSVVSCSQAKGGKPGMSTLQVDGRSVSVYIPATLKPATPVTAILSLHGFFVAASAMASITGLPALADREGFVAIFPEGALGSWNTAGAKCGLGASISSANDDVAFLGKVLDEVAKLQCLDRKKVYATGFSMGGYGAEALVCKRPDLFRAAVGHSGGAPGEPCSTQPAPVMMLHGTTDGTIAYECATMARDFWVSHNGCSAQVDTVTVKGGKCERNRGCPANGQVELCSFEGMGHGWAGSTDLLSGGGDKFESATDLMWRFIKQSP